jgi:hypothetical protein
MTPIRYEYRGFPPSREDNCYIIYSYLGNKYAG